MPAIRPVLLTTLLTTLLTASCLLPLSAEATATAAGPRPQRVMSLNVCTDQLLMLLLPPERIVSLTWLSRTEGDPELAALARRMPVNHGSAEEVLVARPDLVVAGRFTTGTTRALLRRAGMPLLEVDPVMDWEGIRRVTREVAARVGAVERGEALLAAMDAELLAIADERPFPPVRVMGWGGASEDVPTADTLFNAILETAGGVNVAAQASRRGLRRREGAAPGPGGADARRCLHGQAGVAGCGRASPGAATTLRRADPDLSGGRLRLRWTAGFALGA